MDDAVTQDRATADGTAHHLDPRWIAYRRSIGLIRTAVWTVLAVAAAVIAVLVIGVDARAAGAAAAVFVIPIGALLYAWPAFAYRYTTWRMGPRALEIRRGVLWRKVIDVPRSRIQHSDVSQGPLQRRFDLATFSVYTAGHRYAGVQLAGLAHGRALELRELLMQADDDDVV